MLQPNLRKIPALQQIEVRESVVLRPLVTPDAAALLAVLDADPTIRERVGVAARLHTANDVEALQKDEVNDPSIIRYVILESDQLVGMVNLWRAGDYFEGKADPDDYGFGYFLAPSARGRGLITDCLKVLMEVAEEHLPVKKFIAFCEADNQASGAVLKKAGFEKTDVAWRDDEHGWVEQKYAKTV